jgi:hypothetical protein
VVALSSVVINRGLEILEISACSADISPRFCVLSACCARDLAQCLSAPELIEASNASCELLSVCLSANRIVVVDRQDVGVVDFVDVAFTAVWPMSFRDVFS